MGCCRKIPPTKSPFITILLNSNKQDCFQGLMVVVVMWFNKSAKQPPVAPGMFARDPSECAMNLGLPWFFLCIEQGF